MSEEPMGIAIRRLHFDLVEFGKYNDHLWGNKAFKQLITSLHKKLKSKGQYYRIDGSRLPCRYGCTSVIPLSIKKYCKGV